METLEPIYVLTGCTAVGKTELSLSWAEQNDGEIVSCDSLLFYRGMDIGTAKPSEEEMARVPHHLVNICPASEQMDIGRYLELAIDTVREIQSRGKRVLATGGSGFYLKAFFAPVIDQVEVSDGVREQVGELLERSGNEALVEELKRLNPSGLGDLDVDNPRRVVKALERCIQSGKTLGQLKKEFRQQTNPLLEATKHLTVLEREKEELNARIEQRIEIMMKQGLIEEVERLLEDGLACNPSGANSIGYRETTAYLKGEYGLDALKETIATNTRRLAKKQRTWFRSQLPSAKTIPLTNQPEPPIDKLFDDKP